MGIAVYLGSSHCFQPVSKNTFRDSTLYHKARFGHSLSSSRGIEVNFNYGRKITTFDDDGTPYTRSLSTYLYYELGPKFSIGQLMDAHILSTPPDDLSGLNYVDIQKQLIRNKVEKVVKQPLCVSLVKYPPYTTELVLALCTTPYVLLPYVYQQYKGNLWLRFSLVYVVPLEH